MSDKNETKRRAERRERRFGYRGDTLTKAAKSCLEKQSRALREEERMARKRWDDDAERYRKAANAVENAIAEIEEVLPEVVDE